MDIDSPATIATSTEVAVAFEDEESNYGSDFSPEEEQLVAQLLSPQTVTEDFDNPITSVVEHYVPERKLRLPRVLGKEERSALFQAAQAAEEVAEQINDSVSGGEKYPDLDCKIIIPADIVDFLTDAKASSSQPNQRHKSDSSRYSRECGVDRTKTAR